MNWRVQLASAAILLAGATMAASPAGASSVPFTDPNSQGLLALCDGSGHAMTSGTLAATPFVARAVSSVSVPSKYNAKAGGKATLFAYQPRYGVDPGYWSGEQLTGSSIFSSDAHPMAAGTNLDYSLGDFVSTYPAKWDGLVQLRMFFGAPNKSTQTDQYPSAVLQVHGDTWTMLRGATSGCGAGKAVSVEKLLLPASKFSSAAASLSAAAKSSALAHPSTASPSGATPTGSAAAGNSAGSTSPSSGQASPTPSSSGASASLHDVAAKSSANSSGGALTVVVVVLVALAAGAASWWAIRKRRVRST